MRGGCGVVPASESQRQAAVRVGARAALAIVLAAGPDGDEAADREAVRLAALAFALARSAAYLARWELAEADGWQAAAELDAFEGDEQA
jgi:hypothetical protein